MNIPSANPSLILIYSSSLQYSKTLICRGRVLGKEKSHAVNGLNRDPLSVSIWVLVVHICIYVKARVNQGFVITEFSVYLDAYLSVMLCN